MKKVFTLHVVLVKFDDQIQALLILVCCKSLIFMFIIYYVPSAAFNWMQMILIILSCIHSKKYEIFRFKDEIHLFSFAG